MTDPLSPSYLSPQNRALVEREAVDPKRAVRGVFRDALDLNTVLDAARQGETWAPIATAPNETRVKIMDRYGAQLFSRRTLCDAPERGVLGKMAWSFIPQGFEPILWATGQPSYDTTLTEVRGILVNVMNETHALPPMNSHRGIQQRAEAKIMALIQRGTAEPKALRPMADAPRDKTPVSARVTSDLSVLPDRWQAIAGLWFTVRHGGVLDTGFDLGWQYPGHGGLPDRWFEGWWPLPSGDQDPFAQSAPA